MLREVIATGRTVDAAIDFGCEQLGLERDEIDFEIIDMPHKGFLGLSQTPAKVRVFKEEPDAPPVQVVDTGAKAVLAQQYVSDIISAMGLNQVTVTATQEDSSVTLKINGDVSGAAIGRRGETLDALQYLTGLAANRIEGDYMRVVIDSGNYREKRRHTLELLAKKLAAAVAKTGRSTTLEPMNPYERRIIHSTISEIEGVNSSSVGEEPNRCVVISSTNPRPQQSVRHDNRPRNNNNSRSFRQGGGSPPREGGFNKGTRSSDNNSRNTDHRGPRREKPAPYKETSKREIAPAEAANKPLYGKIEL